MIQQPTLPVQQTAVQTQYQQNQVPMFQPAPAAEFNAIKINILGASVGAPAQNGCSTPLPIPVPEQQGQNLNCMA